VVRILSAVSIPMLKWKSCSYLLMISVTNSSSLFLTLKTLIYEGTDGTKPLVTILYVSNRICNVSDEMCNTCATSYVTADNSRPVAYLILKVIRK
jgi:hypothetical protein